MFTPFFRRELLFSIIPHFVRLDGHFGKRILSTLRHSSLMNSIVSFELDDDYILLYVYHVG
ncbi:unnamed protein product, partial [Rotaria sordida]